MKNKKNHNKIYISLVMLLLLGISFVSAFSVSAPYMENKELQLSEDSKITDLEFVLQNGGGATENVSIRVNILDGSEIVSLLGDSNIYIVVPGEKVPVNLRITLPEDVIQGEIYNVRLEFVTVSAGQSGEFGIGTGQEQDFRVLIEKEEKSGYISIFNIPIKKTVLYLIAGILLVCLIIVILLIKRTAHLLVERKKERTIKK